MSGESYPVPCQVLSRARRSDRRCWRTWPLPVSPARSGKPLGGWPSVGKGCIVTVRFPRRKSSRFTRANRMNSTEYPKPALIGCECGRVVDRSRWQFANRLAGKLAGPVAATAGARVRLVSLDGPRCRGQVPAERAGRMSVRPACPVRLDAARHWPRIAKPVRHRRACSPTWTGSLGECRPRPSSAAV